MNDPAPTNLNPPTSRHAHDSASDPLGVTISRAADGSASQAEWALLELHSGESAAAWKHLAMTMRDQIALQSAVHTAEGAAELTQLPASLLLHPAQNDRRFEGRRRIGAWAGWAAAAALTFAMLAPRWGGPRPIMDSGNPVGAVTTNTAGPSFSNAAEALRVYLQTGKEAGTVIDELPAHYLVRATPVESGDGFDVVYVRQIVERARMPDLYRFSRDEAGRGVAVPVRLREMMPVLPAGLLTPKGPSGPV